MRGEYVSIIQRCRPLAALPLASLNSYSASGTEFGFSETLRSYVIVIPWFLAQTRTKAIIMFQSDSIFGYLLPGTGCLST
jgi:hypothetical protein